MTPENHQILRNHLLLTNHPIRRSSPKSHRHCSHLSVTSQTSLHLMKSRHRRHQFPPGHWRLKNLTIPERAAYTTCLRVSDVAKGSETSSRMQKHRGTTTAHGPAPPPIPQKLTSAIWPLMRHLNSRSRPFTRRPMRPPLVAPRPM